MISPEEIREKALKRYRDFLKDWLSTGDSSEFFPLAIRFRHVQSEDDYAETASDVRILREHSKEVLGHGYTVEWREVRSQRFGRNMFPDRIFFETRVDFLETNDRGGAFSRFRQTVRTIRERFPALEPWLMTNIKLTSDLADAGIADGLLQVCDYLVAHPRPGLFARELPIEIDTKFIERHAAGILRPWLDLLLPPVAIRADELHFERRFGLAYPEPLVRLRVLDSELQGRMGFPHPELALPLSAAAQAIRIADEMPAPVVFVVENLVNALTMPPLKNALVLAGLGGQANLFRDLTWLHDCPALFYWGDIDVQGFEILSQFRTWFPGTDSLLMDTETSDRFARFKVDGVPGITEQSLNLTDAESTVLRSCESGNWRLEQEKIPQGWIERTLATRNLLPAPVMNPDNPGP